MDKKKRAACGSVSETSFAGLPRLPPPLEAVIAAATLLIAAGGIEDREVFAVGLCSTISRGPRAEEPIGALWIISSASGTAEDAS